jgi:hypothetical protein
MAQWLAQQTAVQCSPGSNHFKDQRNFADEPSWQHATKQKDPSICNKPNLEYLLYSFEINISIKIT